MSFKLILFINFICVFIKLFVFHSFVVRFAGKLHRHIVQLQVSEGTAVRKLEDAHKKITRLEAQLLQREHKLDDKDQTIYHNRLEARSKTKYLKHTVQVSRNKC